MKQPERKTKAGRPPSIICPSCKIRERPLAPNYTHRERKGYCKQCETEKALQRYNDPALKPAYMEAQRRYREKIRSSRPPKPQYSPLVQEIIDASSSTSKDCIEFTGCISRLGYGIISYDNKRMPASRLSLMFKLGREIAEGMETLHSCDNRKCINGNHLSEGTHKQNMEQASARGRMSTPRTYHRRKNGSTRRAFTDDQVRHLRKLYADRTPFDKIREHYPNLKHATYYNIVGRLRTYKDVQ